jgi:nucleoside-diphosphate-sugar epimerase
VVHLATQFIARHDGPRDAIVLVRANVEFGAAVLDACSAAGSSLVCASTVWQHFEGGAYAPVSFYAATKQAFEDLATYYELVEGVAVTRLVLGDSYGPGDDRGKLLTALLSAARTGQEIAMSDGLQVWDPVHALDVADAFALLVARDPGARGSQWQLRSGEAVSIRRWCDRIEQAIGRPVPVAWGARPSRGREMLGPWVVAPPPPGWRPRQDFEASVRGIWVEEYARPPAGSGG